MPDNTPQPMQWWRWKDPRETGEERSPTPQDRDVVSILSLDAEPMTPWHYFAVSLSKNLRDFAKEGYFPEPRPYAKDPEHTFIITNADRPGKGAMVTMAHGDEPGTRILRVRIRRRDEWEPEKPASEWSPLLTERFTESDVYDETRLQRIAGCILAGGLELEDRRIRTIAQQRPRATRNIADMLATADASDEQRRMASDLADALQDVQDRILVSIQPSDRPGEIKVRTALQNGEGNAPETIITFDRSSSLVRTSAGHRMEGMDDADRFVASVLDELGMPSRVVRQPLPGRDGPSYKRMEQWMGTMTERLLQAEKTNMMDGVKANNTPTLRRIPLRVRPYNVYVTQAQFDRILPAGIQRDRFTGIAGAMENHVRASQDRERAVRTHPEEDSMMWNEPEYWQRQARLTGFPTVGPNGAGDVQTPAEVPQSWYPMEPAQQTWSTDGPMEEGRTPGKEANPAYEISDDSEDTPDGFYPGGPERNDYHERSLDGYETRNAGQSALDDPDPTLMAGQAGTPGMVMTPSMA